MVYEIRLKGTAERIIATAFSDDFEVTAQSGTTVLRGDLPDQAALFGVLEKIDRLGLVLLEVHRQSLDTRR